MKMKFLSQRSLAVVLTTMLLLVAIPAIAVFAASSGPNSAGTGANVDNSGAAYSWTNAGNVTASDDQYAQVTLLNTSSDSDYLQATNFSFNIPSDAAILGVEVAVERSAVCVVDPCTSNVTDAEVKLIKGSVVQSTNKASATAWPGTDTVKTYGGPSDLWGTTWTAANINATNFGVAISVGRNAGGDKIARVDHVTITVTYERKPTLSVTNSPVTYTGTAQAATLEASVAGTVSDVKYDGSSTVPTDAGTYAVTADFVPTDPSYNTLNDASAGNFVIAKASLTVTADDKTKKVGQADPAFTFAYSGFVNGETGAVINTPPSCDVSVAHSTVGTYPIVCSGGADNNYSFNYVDGTLTVTPIASGQTFEDVPTNYWAWEFIERLYAAGITGGCNTSPLMYCPETTVTRAQMAVFLERGINGASFVPPAVGASTGFGDVPPDYWAAAFIKQLVADGITVGCGNGNYCPENGVTRAQMAVFLLRSEHGGSYTPPAVGSDTGFGDVPTDYWAAAFIKQLVAEGITFGCGTNIYCPEEPVTRAQMAVFLVRTFGLP
jgi:hypothetical protein